MVMQAMRQGAAGGVMKFVIFGFLIMAVGGMVLMDVGGFFRSGGVGGNDVAKIGKEKISLPYFDRSLRRSLSQLGIGPQDAYKAGYVDQFLAAEVRSHLFSQAAANNGILVGNKRIASQIKSMLGPMVQAGQDPKEVLRLILMNQGMSEGDLARAIGQEISLGLLNKTILGGFAAGSDELAADLFAFESETRDVAFISFPDGEYTLTQEPDNEQLKKLYEMTKDMVYASDEIRTLKLIKIKTDALKNSVQIDDEEIRGIYDSNIELYSEKEQRTLEQALFDKEEEAKNVAEKVKSGTGLKQAVKSVTGRDTDYLGERTFETESIPPEISKDVLTVQKSGGAIGPLKTAIGWQVIVVKKISPTQTKSFESVKKEIRDELLETKIIDEQYTLAGTVEDMLAGGASLDEVKKEVDIETIDLSPMNQSGRTKDGGDALKNYEKAKPYILENAFSLPQGETSPMSELADGSFAGVYVESIQPKSYTPFEEVKTGMAKKLKEDQRKMENKLQAMELLQEIKDGKISSADFAKSKNKELQTRSNITRRAQPAKPFNERSWANLFEAAPGEPFILDIDGGTAIAWVTSAELPEKVATDSSQFKEFQARLLEATKNEAMAVYVDSKGKEYGAALNQRLLERAYGQAPEEN
ncbi:MAG: peptidyl-prolyl cis-trans isomerase [Alphaproteobacteria bacterium]